MLYNKEYIFVFFKIDLAVLGCDCKMQKLTCPAAWKCWKVRSDQSE